jgi:hypothetical protein
MSTETAGGASRIGARGYLALGGVSGLVALVFVPIIFGPFAMFCGVQLYRRHSEWYGLAMLAWGGVCLVIGWFIGLLLLGV